MTETLAQAGGSYQRSSAFISGFEIAAFDAIIPIWYTTYGDMTPKHLAVLVNQRTRMEDRK